MPSPLDDRWQEREEQRQHAEKNVQKVRIVNGKTKGQDQHDPIYQVEPELDLASILHLLKYQLRYI